MRWFRLKPCARRGPLGKSCQFLNYRYNRARKRAIGVRIFRTHLTLYPTGISSGSIGFREINKRGLNGIGVLWVTSETKFQLRR